MTVPQERLLWKALYAIFMYTRHDKCERGAECRARFPDRGTANQLEAELRVEYERVNLPVQDRRPR